jgi:hypothetical protein
LGDWVGPALVAAIIAALVSVAGWFVSTGLSFRAEQRRRDEKTRDFMIALRAEIRSELADMTAFDLTTDLKRVADLYQTRAEYRVFVPAMVAMPITAAIVPEIWILPEKVIDPVVVYLRQRNSVGLLTQEVRIFDVERYGRDQELALFGDLTEMRMLLETAAREALEALDGAS